MTQSAKSMSVHIPTAIAIDCGLPRGMYKCVYIADIVGRALICNESDHGYGGL